MNTITTAAWNVYLTGQRVATVELADRQVGAFREQLADRTAELRLAAWENGTLTTGGRKTHEWSAEKSERMTAELDEINEEADFAFATRAIERWAERT